MFVNPDENEYQADENRNYEYRRTKHDHLLFEEFCLAQILTASLLAKILEPSK